jgi:hypothetical protein
MTLALDFYSFFIQCLGNEWVILKHIKTCHKLPENIKKYLHHEDEMVKTEPVIVFYHLIIIILKWI